MEVTLHFDPTCPWTWRTSRWLLRAAGVEGLDIRWAPFSLDHQGAEDHEGGRPALRVVQHLLDKDDHDAIARYYDAYGDLAHESGHEMNGALATRAATAAGLDAAAIAAVDDESLDARVGETTERAFAAAGGDVGSPILHWVDDGDVDVWIFGPLVDEVPDAPCAAEVWRGVRHLAVHRWFKELKRGRSRPPA